MFPNFDENPQNEDFLNEFRQKLNDQSLSSLEEKKNEINRSKNIFISAVSGVALAGVVGWFVLSPRYASDPNIEVPVIRRPQTAIKVQPTEPGGMEILNQDKTVYDIIEKKETPTQTVENLLPPPEEPQMPVIEPAPEVQEKTVVTETKPVSDVVEKEEIKIAEVSAPIAVASPKDEAEAVTVPLAEAVKKDAAPKTETIAKAEAEKKEPERKNVVSIKIPAKPEIEAVKKEAQNTQTAPAGSWVVQLMASNNKTATQNAWDGLVKKYAVLKGKPHEVEIANLGAKGTFYRLLAGSYGTRNDADKLCNDIKALGGSCLVKKK